MALLDKARRALAAEGLFDAARKRPLPFLPRVIGVVTSPTGAVIRDILHRLADRFPTPCPGLAGAGAGRGRGGAGRRRDRAASTRCAGGPMPRPDLLIVARGGGSIEDLWAFNEEVVVRAVADSRDPDHLRGRARDRHHALRFRRRPARADADRRRRNGGAGARRTAGAGPRAWRAGRALRPADGASAAAEQLQALLRHWPEREALLAPQRQKLDELAERLPRGLRRPARPGAGRARPCRRRAAPRPARRRASSGERAAGGALAGGPARPSGAPARKRLCPGHRPGRQDAGVGGGGARGASCSICASATARWRRPPARRSRRRRLSARASHPIIRTRATSPNCSEGQIVVRLYRC